MNIIAFRYAVRKRNKWHLAKGSTAKDIIGSMSLCGQVKVVCSSSLIGVWYNALLPTCKNCLRGLENDNND